MTQHASSIFEDFRTARGQDGDVAWAETAYGRLVLLDDVRMPVAERELSRVADLVRATGEGPTDLFGEPREWAAATLRGWQDEGVDYVQDPAFPWRDVPAIGAVVAALIYLAFGVVALVQGGGPVDYTWGLLLGPVLLGGLVLVAQGLFERSLGRMGLVAAGAVGLAVAVPGILLLAWLFVGTADDPVHRGSVWWTLALALAALALAWLLARVVPDAPRPAARPQPSDDAWAREVGSQLRLRAAYPETRVRQLLDEARGHAAQAGTTLAEEFGPARAYAGRFAVDGRRRAVRSAILWTLLVGVALVAAWGSDGWFIWVAFGLLVLNTAGQWLRVTRT